MTQPNRARRIIKACLFWSAYAIALAALFVGGLKLIDRRLGRTRVSNDWLDTESRKKTIRTLELFPYDGFHLQANFHHVGPMPWNEYTPEANFDVRTGDMGFMVDFRLESPPAKQENEFRIILTGGSGAQGWGATRNEAMLYRQLERYLLQRLAPLGIRVRVINMAMGATHLYQNYISLNRWGHALEPDMILAYAGRNDVAVPLGHEQGTDGHLAFTQLNGLAMAVRGSEMPPSLRWLDRLMPNLMSRTSIGLGLKTAFGYDYLKMRAWESYIASRGLRVQSQSQFWLQDRTPMMINALKSMKRDFEGIPIMLGWQATNEYPPHLYDAMYEQVKGELTGYYNDRWWFENYNVISHRNNWNWKVHLSDSEQEVLARIMVGPLTQIIPELMAERRRKQAGKDPGAR